MSSLTLSSQIDVARTLEGLREKTASWRADRGTIAFVPTMGALHDGHLSLMRLAQTLADHVVASIYVNPTQFAPGEDFEAYPRDFEVDLEKLSGVGVDLAYLPEPDGMYAPDHTTLIRVDGVGEGLETDHRPTFFQGVALIVTKLFNRVQPDVAIFGEKDFQQLAVIRRLVRDLDLPIKIIGAPIARDAHGLALSSRNRYFDEDSLGVARRLNQIMFNAAERLAKGTAAAETSNWAKSALMGAGFSAIDYVTIADADTLVPLGQLGDTEARVLIAAHCPSPTGPVRLIDNCAVPARD
jgi:pantoate--beta-alanine ligase